VTAKNAFEAQPSSRGDAVVVDGLSGVFGAGRMIPAMTPHEGTNQQLVEANQAVGSFAHRFAIRFQCMEIDRCISPLLREAMPGRAMTTTSTGGRR
jgi:hypothetical protein